jgi:hypothetical protein
MLILKMSFPAKISMSSQKEAEPRDCSLIMEEGNS